MQMTTAKKSKKQVFAERLFSTLLLWAVVTATFLSGSPWAFVGLITLLGVAASREFFAMSRKANFPCQNGWGLFLSVIYLLVVGYLLAADGEAALPVLGAIDGASIAFVVLSAFILQLRHPIDGEKSLISVAATALGFLYIAFLFSYMGRLLFVPDGEGVTGAWLIIWVVAVTKFTDMGAYITGSLIGKNKMIPHISPGKTWEGFVGALFWAQLAGCGLYALLPAELAVLGAWHHVIILGVLLALLAVVGDLAESIVKRCLDAKDSGQTLPGIGGALDLIDSLCFTAPVLYFYILWVIN